MWDTDSCQCVRSIEVKDTTTAALVTVPATWLGVTDPRAPVTALKRGVHVRGAAPGADGLPWVHVPSAATAGPAAVAAAARLALADDLAVSAADGDDGALSGDAAADAADADLDADAVAAAADDDANDDAVEVAGGGPGLAAVAAHVPSSAAAAAIAKRWEATAAALYSHAVQAVIKSVVA